MGRKNRGVQAVLLGPDTRHGAEARKGFKEYKWYGSYYERGQRRLRSLGKTYGENYERELAALRIEVAGAVPAKRGASDAQVSLVINEYLKSRIGRVFTERNVANRCENLVKYFTGRWVSDIDRHLCEEYARTRPSAGTARVELGTLSTALRYGRDANLFAIPVPKIWRPPPPPSRERVYTRSEIARIVWNFRGRRGGQSRHFALATLVAYYTGARIQSVLDLRWAPSSAGGWVDLKSNMIHLRPEGRPKTKKVKPSIIIPIKLAALLRALRRHNHERVCHSPRGGGSARTFQQAWQSCLEELRIQHGVPHSLRHTRITHMVAGGVPLAIVSSYAGVDVATLMRTYAHLQPGHGVEAARFRK